MSRLGAQDRARLDRMQREGERLAGRRVAVAETDGRAPGDGLLEAIERGLLNCDDPRRAVRLLAAFQPELRAELDRAKGAGR